MTEEGFGERPGLAVASHDWRSVLRMKRAESVLIIDDEAQVRLLLRLGLEAAGFVVFVAGSGTEGLEQYRHTPTNFVVIDLLLPDMDGAVAILDLTREFSDVKIVAISGGSGDLLATARELGAHSVVMKPFGPRQLVQVLKALVRT